MILFSPPSQAVLRRFVERHQSAPLSYAAPGCTKDNTALPGFWRDASHAVLGAGRTCFEAARQTVLAAEFYPTAMATLFCRSQSIAEQDTVAVVYRFRPLPVWFLLADRIIDRFDEQCETSTGIVHRAGFTYGTLAEHFECGEERFEVAWNEATDEVTFSIIVQSRPAWWLTWLGWPYTRYEQARFRRLAIEGMRTCISNSLVLDLNRRSETHIPSPRT